MIWRCFGLTGCLIPRKTLHKVFKTNERCAYGAAGSVRRGRDGRLPVTLIDGGCAPPECRACEAAPFAAEATFLLKRVLQSGVRAVFGPPR